jgi:hypothetical protein
MVVHLDHAVGQKEGNLPRAPDLDNAPNLSRAHKVNEHVMLKKHSFRATERTY